MSRTLSDFVIVDSLNPRGLGTLNVPALKRLSSEELRDILTRESQAYMGHHGKPVKCLECREPITDPAKLVRYAGMNLGVDCLPRVLAEDEKKGYLNNDELDYFKMVAEVMGN